MTQKLQSVFKFSITALFLTLILSTHNLASAAVGDMPANLLRAYAFDETSGTTAIDSSSAGSNSTLVGSPTRAASKYSNGLVFDGTDDRANGPSVTLPNTFTFMAWVNNASNQSYETLVTVGSNRDFYLSSGVISFWDNSTDILFGAAIPTGSWQHVALGYNGTQMQAYLNGVPHGAPSTVSLGQVSGNIQLGALINGSTNSDFFSGGMDEVMVYGRSLTQTEIQLAMNTTIGGTPVPTPTPSPTPTPTPTATPSIGIRLAVMSDSSSDEYRANDNRAGNTIYAATTLAWTELIEEYRSFNLGPWGSRSEPRRSGFEYNWARSGAEADDVVSTGQHTGIAAQVQSGLIDIVYFQIGNNDFAYYRDGADIYNGTLAGQTLTNKINDYIVDVTTALDTVLAANSNVKVIIGNIPDPSNGPHWQSQFPDPAKRQLVTDAVAQANSKILTLISSRPRAILFDSEVFVQSILSRVDSSGNVMVGGQAISITLNADEPHHMTLSDNIHGGTVGEGLYANAIIEKINQVLATNVAVFTDSELLSNAGIVPSTPTPTPTPGTFQNQSFIVGLTQPTTVQFLPDGRMLILERLGTIKIVQSGASTFDTTPFMTLTNINIDEGERGLSGITLDPNFSSNGHFYLFYTANSPLRDRVSRFTATGNTASLGSELIVWQDNVDAFFWHHGGSVAFGPDGKLYISVGDHFDDGSGSSHASQRLNSYHGKILRINADGTVPADNPFHDGAGANLDAIWARGLRNPFRFSFDSLNGTMHIGDVGGNVPTASIEELNRGVAGANYGWPLCEGTCGTSGMTNPIFTYPHNNRDASITGGFVYRGTQFPSAYQGSYIYGDYAQNWIKRLTLNTDGSVNQNINFLPENGAADTGLGDIVDLKMGPEGSLYYVDIALDINGQQTGAGSVRKVSFFTNNQPPVITTAAASPQTGNAPLQVSFTSSSTDANNDTLTYSWDFGNGQSATGQNVSHTYTTGGSFIARLSVSDGVNTTLSNALAISVGQAPVATIVNPTNGMLFRAGDVINFQGSATDSDNTLSESSYSWTVLFHHDGHVHPAAGPIVGSTGTFTIPTSGHDFSGNTNYELILTVTDPTGLTDEESVTINPDKVNVSFQTTPTGLSLSIDGISSTAPFVKSTLKGFAHTINAAPTQVLSGKTYQFVSLSDSGAANHSITVPTAAATYTAVYQEVTGDISGQVYIDVNTNGVKDSGEASYQGAVLNLSGAGTGSTTSALNGTYEFSDRSLGNYTVAIVAPSGYLITTSPSVNVTLGSSAVANFGIAVQSTPTTVTFQISAGANDVNQVNTTLSTGNTTGWLGTGGSSSSSYTGLRFTGVTIPKNAQIQSARLEVYSTQGQWQSIGLNIGADASGSSSAFSTSALPSLRTLTTARLVHTSNVNWTTNTWYQFTGMQSVIQEVVNRSDWNSGNSLSLIARGTVGTWGRKFIRTFEGNAQQSSRLVVTYQ